MAAFPGRRPGPGPDGRRAAGLLVAKELKFLGGLMQGAEKPYIAILGGSKVSDKIKVIENLIGRIDTLLIGGAMAYTFLRAKGIGTGNSLVEADKLDVARSLMSSADARKTIGKLHGLPGTARERLASPVDARDRFRRVAKAAPA